MTNKFLERYYKEHPEALQKREEETNNKNENDNKKELDISLLDYYENQPFREYKEDEIKDLKESIERVGLINPIVVRQKDNGRYEILSGNNRVKVFKELGRDKIEAKIVDVKDDDLAKLIMIDSNMVQRSEISPMERARAYEIKRNIREKKKWSVDDESQVLSEEEKETIKQDESTTTFYRYLSLNKLIPELQNKCNDESLSVKAGEILSRLDNNSQKLIFNTFPTSNISEGKATKLYNLYKEKNNSLNEENINELFSGNKDILKPVVRFTNDEMKKYFNKVTSNEELKELVIKALGKMQIAKFKE